MSTNTTNYNLTKLDGSDLGAIIDINGNADKIDAALKQNRDDQQLHTENKDNPHSVTKAQVGLGNVDNTADSDKPVSAAQQSALNKKADLSSDGKVPAAQLPSLLTPETIVKAKEKGIDLLSEEGAENLNRLVQTFLTNPLMDSGTVSGWHYRKYADGYCEIEKQFTQKVHYTTADMGGNAKGSTIEEQVPFLFSKVTYANLTGMTTNGCISTNQRVNGECLAAYVVNLMASDTTLDTLFHASVKGYL